MATILRLPDVQKKIGLSRSAIYQYIAEGSFPTSIALGSRAVGWIEAEIDDWIAGRIKLARPAKTKSPKPMPKKKGRPKLADILAAGRV